MKSSIDRILTTHMGSLPQVPALHARLMARAEGGADDKRLDADVQQAVADSVRRQVESGVSVVNDGEQGKSSWAAYVKDRLNGLEGDDVPRPRPRDAGDFPDFYSTDRISGSRPSCSGPLSWKDFGAVDTDIA